jgi:hypothetical protein
MGQGSPEEEARAAPTRRALHYHRTVEQARSLVLVQVPAMLGSAYGTVHLLCLPLLPGTRSQLGNNPLSYGIPDSFLYHVKPFLATIFRDAECPSSLHAQERG